MSLIAYYLGREVCTVGEPVCGWVTGELDGKECRFWADQLKAQPWGNEAAYPTQRSSTSE